MIADHNNNNYISAVEKTFNEQAIRFWHSGIVKAQAQGFGTGTREREREK